MTATEEQGLQNDTINRALVVSRLGIALMSDSYKKKNTSTAITARRRGHGRNLILANALRFFPAHS